MELKSFTDNFLNEFTNYIKEDNKSKWFWRIIGLFVGFRDNNRCQYFEVQ